MLTLLKCLIEFAYEAIRSWTFFLLEVFKSDSISVLILGLFIFYISSWFSYMRLYLSKNLTILLKQSTYFSAIPVKTPMAFITGLEQITPEFV